jgi:hypothetical protein
LHSIENSTRERRITRHGFDSCSAKLIPPNSVVMSSRAPIGHFAINTVPVCSSRIVARPDALAAKHSVLRRLQPRRKPSWPHSRRPFLPKPFEEDYDAQEILTPQYHGPATTPEQGTDYRGGH